MEKIKSVLKDRKKLLIILAVVVVVCFALYGGYRYKYSTVYYRSTFINDVDVSDMTLDEASQALSQKIDDLNLTITDKNGDKYKYSLVDDLGVRYSLEESLQAIKEESDHLNLYDQLFTTKEYTLDVFKLDSKKATKVIEKSQYYKDGEEDKTTNAKSSFDKDKLKFVVKKEYQGTNIITEDFISAIETQINQNNFKINLKSGDYYEQPTILSDDKDLNEKIDAYNSYLKAEITYTMPSTTVKCDISTYHSWLKYNSEKKTVSIKSDKIEEYVKSLANSYDTYNKSRSFKTTNKGTITISGGSLGYLTNQSEEVKKLKENILNNDVVTRKPVYSQEEAGNNGVGSNYVEVDLSGQHIYCYKGGSLVVSSDCVTGNTSNGHGTPTGVYRVNYKQSPATLKGAIDPSTGQREYETPVTYWMPFNGGVGFHDATWRSSFGGSIYKTNGSHGCVNLPYSAAQSLYSTIDAGYLVIVY